MGKIEGWGMIGSNGPGSFIDPLAALGKLLSHYENRWVAIGGVAVSILARPRFTEDLDAMILLSVAVSRTPRCGVFSRR